MKKVKSVIDDTENMYFNSKVLSLIYSILFLDLEGFEDVYMVEVRSKDVLKNLLFGDFTCHVAPHKLKSCAEHLFDNEWLVYHYKDDIFQQIDKNKVEQMLKWITEEE